MQRWVRGRADDRINHGRLGPKGLVGWQGQRLAAAGLRRSADHPAPVTAPHAVQIFRYAEEGSIGFLWISGTNPLRRALLASAVDRRSTRGYGSAAPGNPRTGCSW